MRSVARSLLARLRSEDGQIIPIVIMAMVALIAIGIALFQVGEATVLRSEAQSAADAAALAGARNVDDQLAFAANEAPDEILDALVCSEAKEYARRNGGEITENGCTRRGLDVLVTVRTRKALEGADAEDAGVEATRTEARARARVTPSFALPQPGGGGVPTGDVSGDLKDAIELAQSSGLVVTSLERPGDSDSLHSQGLAADVAGSPAAMENFYNAALDRYDCIEELFYDPIGAIDKNLEIPPIGGHSDHVHIAVTSPGGKPCAPKGGERPPIDRGDGAPVDELPATGPPIRLVPYDER